MLAMTEKKDDQEQSMEEILASIRKIISEEEKGTEVSEPSNKDDILTLNNVVEKDDGVAAKTDDILELTEVVSDSSINFTTEVESDRTSETHSKTQGPEHNLVKTDGDRYSVNEEFESYEGGISTTKNPVEASNFLEGNAETHTGLVNDENAERINAALTKLSVINKDDQTELAPSQKINDFDNQANEIMLPIIKKWLDENLADLVENIVRDEIKRLSQISSRQNK
tara:strand:+ start:1516 stop:2193 length:678 start_codon:yes stop_codon:yes gene_type:complete